MRLPGADGSYDLLICRRGPFHWVEDARRVARPSATLLMLVPDPRPLPPWNDRLPEILRLSAPADPHWARPAIEKRLAIGGNEESPIVADTEFLGRWSGGERGGTDQRGDCQSEKKAPGSRTGVSPVSSTGILPVIRTLESDT